MAAALCGDRRPSSCVMNASTSPSWSAMSCRARRSAPERAGGRVATVVGSHFAHPATDDLGTPMMFGRTTYNHSPSDLKHYCMTRNNVVNLREYVGWLGVLAFLVKTVWFYLFTRPSGQRLALSAGAVRAGIRNDFTGHERFLR